ncbi:hypothetical protein B5P45_07040 [Phyllobacterium zundukense]|uniref:Uncharacterized protein n=1 Tax=Phyllobacterium zundukense TaxID=1867719 RepID=A0A2N9W1W9_9HYPH|nr:hypothetical protein BLM14_07495 [Phyllobacterium zundukense]PIO45737.1 hypothetical protein B5P45_07040 [Phyllobacterium zundukense]
MSTIHNERTKLLATYFNGIAIAILVIGAISPVLSSTDKPPLIIALQIAICIVLSGALHYVASQFLGRMVN